MPTDAVLTIRNELNATSCSKQGARVMKIADVQLLLCRRHRDSRAARRRFSVECRSLREGTLDE